MIKGLKLLFMLSCPWAYIMIFYFFIQLEHFVPKYIQTQMINLFSKLPYKALLHPPQGEDDCIQH
jgi:hypothetical protein